MGVKTNIQTNKLEQRGHKNPLVYMEIYFGLDIQMLKNEVGTLTNAMYITEINLKYNQTYK